MTVSCLPLSLPAYSCLKNVSHRHWGQCPGNDSQAECVLTPKGTGPHHGVANREGLWLCVLHPTFFLPRNTAPEDPKHVKSKS